MTSGTDVTILPAPSMPSSLPLEVNGFRSPSLMSSIDKIRKIESRYLELCRLNKAYVESGHIPKSFVDEVCEYENEISSDLNDEEVASYYANQITEEKVSEYLLTRKRSGEPLTEQPPAKKIKVSEIESSHGLPNLGSTCFANSVLQLLFHTPGIEEILNQKVTIESDPEVKLLEKKLQDANASGNQPEIARLTVLLNEERAKASDRIEFRKNLKQLWIEYSKDSPDKKIIVKLLATLWNSPALKQLKMRSEQEDAHEFLVLISSILHVETHPNFHLMTLSMRVNPTADRKVLAHEVKESIQLPISKKSATLQGCFDHYLQTESLEQAEIAALTEAIDCTSKRLFFTGQPPESIQFGLKRFNHLNQKISTPISGFDQPMFVPFCNAEGTVITQVAFQVDAVVCHDGRSPYGGHYTTFFKTSDGWLELNDRYEKKYSHAEGLAVIEKNGYIVKARKI